MNCLKFLTKQNFKVIVGKPEHKFYFEIVMKLKLLKICKVYAANVII